MQNTYRPHGIFTFYQAETVAKGVHIKNGKNIDIS